MKKCRLADYFFAKANRAKRTSPVPGDLFAKLAGREDFTVVELWELCRLDDLDPIKAFSLHVADRKEAE
jgi:hypothetical protein